MKLDEPMCLCFHVSKRKVINYIRINQPAKASQLSECFGAGTGCGWCRPFLERLVQQAQQKTGVFDAHRCDDPSIDDLPDLLSYAAGREKHRH